MTIFNCASHKHLCCFFQKAFNLRAIDCWEVVKKCVNRFVGLQIVNQVLDWHAPPEENGRTTEYFT